MEKRRSGRRNAAWLAMVGLASSLLAGVCIMGEYSVVSFAIAMIIALCFGAGAQGTWRRAEQTFDQSTRVAADFDAQVIELAKSPEFSRNPSTVEKGWLSFGSFVGGARELLGFVSDGFDAIDDL